MNIKVLGTMLATIAVAGVIFFALQTNKADKPRPIDPANVVKSTINMTGMTCGHCEVAIEKVGQNRGVAKIKAISEDQRVEVEYDKTQTDIKTIMDAIQMKGFTPVSYEDESGLHEQNVSKAEMKEPEMKCGSGKCGTGKCGAQ
jgi:copper chaperone